MWLEEVGFAFDGREEGEVSEVLGREGVEELGGDAGERDGEASQVGAFRNELVRVADGRSGVPRPDDHVLLRFCRNAKDLEVRRQSAILERSEVDERDRVFDEAAAVNLQRDELRKDAALQEVLRCRGVDVDAVKGKGAEERERLTKVGVTSRRGAVGEDTGRQGEVLKAFETFASAKAGRRRRGNGKRKKDVPGEPPKSMREKTMQYRTSSSTRL